MASNKLFLIPKTNSFLSKLLRILEIRLPKSAMTYNITKAFLDNRLSPEGAIPNIEFYSSNEQMDENKSLIVIIQTRKFSKALVVTISIPEDPHLALDQDTLKSFENTIEWSRPLLFGAVDSKFTKLLKIFPSIINGKTDFDENYFYTMSIHDAGQLNIPNLGEKNIQVKELNPEDASTVSHYWKFSSGPSTVSQMQDAMKSMGSMGLFLNSKLISWILISHIGSLNALYTLEEFRRKGYAEMTMKAIAKHCSEKGFIPNAQVQMPNISSKLLMEKTGFKYSHQVEWIDYEPTS